MGTLQEDLLAFLIIDRPVLLKMRNVSVKLCRGNQNTHFMFNNIFLENRSLCDIMRKNVVERSRSQMATWRMRIACWIHRTRNTHTGCVVLTAFLLQQWLYERASMLCYTYIVCRIVCYCDGFDECRCQCRLFVEP
jgi:hypothetical protein